MRRWAKAKDRDNEEDSFFIKEEAKTKEQPIRSDVDNHHGKASRSIEDLEANIFWESYGQVEQVYQPFRFQALLPVIGFCWELYRTKILKLPPITGEVTSNTTTIPTGLPNSSKPPKTKPFVSNPVDVSNDRFSVYFQSKTMTVCISVLTINLISLALLFLTMLTQKYINSEEIKDTMLLGYNTLMMYILPWVIFNVVVLLYFGAIVIWGYKYLQERVNMLEIWYLIGYSLFYSRCYLALTNLLRYLTEDLVCYGYPTVDPGTKLAAYFYIFLFTIDVYQLAVISVIPFPWPTPFHLFLIVTLEQFLRFYDCSEVLFTDGTTYNLMKGMTCAVMLSITAVSVIQPLGFERSVRFSYMSVQAQNKAAQEKMNLVNMLCRDIKAPAQQFIQIFKSLEPLLVKAPMKMTSRLASLQVLSSTINLVVDDLLFLVRVEEGRFRFACQDVVQVKSSLKQIYSALVSTSMQGSVSFVNESMFDSSQVHMETITTDKNCFQVLMYYSLIAVANSFSLLPRNAGNGSSISKITVKMGFHKEQIDAAEVTIQAVGAQTAPKQVHLASDIDIDKDSFLESCCIICKKVVRTFQGQWSLTSDGVRFSIRVEPPTKKDIFRNSSERINIPYSMQSSRISTNLIIPECCIFITDSMLQHLVTDIVHQLPGGLEVVIHNQVSAPVLKLYQIVFVQSIRACLEVREKGFTGKIVLCSERLTYLDEREKSHFDYGLSLPCSEVDLIGLMTWLNDEATHGQTDMVTANLVFQPTSWLFVECTWTRWVLMVQQVLNPGGLSAEVNESYLRWKYIAPTGCRFHPSYRVDFVFVMGMITLIIALLTNVIRMRNFLANLSVVVLLVSTKYLCIYAMATYRIKLSTWWTASNLVYGGLVVISTIAEYFYVDQSRGLVFIDRSHLAHKPFSDFVAKNAHGPSGSEFLFYLSHTFGFSSFYADFMCFPISSIVTFIQMIRCIFMIRGIFSYYLELPMIRYLVWLIVALGLLIILIQYHHERILRLQFLDLYNLLQSRKFLDHCLCSSRESLLQPILHVKSQYEDFLQLVLQHCVEERLFLKPTLISSMLVMKGLNQTYEEQVTSLFASDATKFTFAQAKQTNELIRQMKVYYIKQLVGEVCTSLSTMYMDHLSVMAGPLLCNSPTIRIFLQLHPALSVIRVDKQFFCALVSNTCRIAIERIQEGIQHHARERGYQHQLLLWIEPSTKQSVQRFTDVRVMEVTVFDTSEVSSCFGGGGGGVGEKKKFISDDADDFIETFLVLDSSKEQTRHSNALPPTGSKAHKAKSSRRHQQQPRQRYTVVKQRNPRNMRSLLDSYSFGISSKFMQLFNLPIIAEAGLIKHPIYNTYQKIGIPYMLCTDSHKFEQWMTLEKTFVVGMEQTSRVQAFHRYFASYNVKLDVHNFTRFQDLPNSFERRKTRKSTGNVHLLCNARSMMRYSLHSVGEEFKHHHWTAQAIYVESLPLDNSTYGCDCMVIDEDILIKHVVPMTCRDLVKYIFAHDFAGIVVVVQQAQSFTDTTTTGTIVGTGGSSNNNGSGKAAKFLQRNPYLDAAQADLYFELPLSTKQIKSIIECSEIKNIANLIT